MVLKTSEKLFASLLLNNNKKVNFLWKLNNTIKKKNSLVPE